MARFLVFVLFGVLVGETSAKERVNYVRDIKPILKERCYSCHGALKQRARLRLDSVALIRKGGRSGPVIQVGKSARSVLLARVTSTDKRERMPPRGPRLTARQIQLLTTWIDQGAQAEGDDRPEDDPHNHWAFQPPVKSALPSIPDEVGVHNPIDVFLAHEQAKRGLKPLPTADRRVLLRRVYLDLIGLPPTPTELRDFLSDTSPDAYEKVVDRLLASPAYGERWGRHWMDVWRYSDWYGLGKQLRYSQKHIWHWRDWIIESLNADKGYDRMVVEMLAGDELAPTDRSTLRATGFLARNYFLFNRTTWLNETIEHTSKAFLGLTMQCARCHDHKYDPITQRDFYRFRAIFEPHQVRLDAVPGETNLERDGLPRVFDAHLKAPTYLHVQGNPKQPDTSEALAPGVPAFLKPLGWKVQAIALPPEAHTPALQPFVLRDQLQLVQQQIASAEQELTQARRQWTQARKTAVAGTATLTTAKKVVAAASKAVEAGKLRMEALQAAHRADVARHRGEPSTATTEVIRKAAQAEARYQLVRAEVQLLRLERKKDTAKGKARAQVERQLKQARKQLQQAQQRLASPGEKYTPLRASLKAREGPDESETSRRQPYPKQSTGRRLALARWITHRQNPLAARVAVNHIWLRHLGQPLAPVTDLGTRAKEPALRALLDWLAVDFMEHGWSMKHLHRLMVTSQAYQRSGVTRKADPQTIQKDSENRFYWKRSALRMESQVIRDSMLHLAGVLRRQMGGPSLRTEGKSYSSSPDHRTSPQEDGRDSKNTTSPCDARKGDTQYRRSLYFAHSRDDVHPFLTMFDDANILACYRRTESIVPQQALTLANSKLSLSMARQLANRLQTRMQTTSDEEFITVAFETVLCVLPEPEEKRTCLEALQQMRTILQRRKHPQPTARARANLVHALLNHNEFITIR